MSKTLVERLREGCDCSEQVCEMDTFSEQAADRIEELEAELAYCAPYLKDGETPAERIQRERDDNCAVLKLLAQEKRRVEELQASTIHDKYVSAMKRIEELEAENRIFRATESVDDTVWDALLEQIRSHQSRIKELEALRDRLTDELDGETKLLGKIAELEAALQRVREIPLAVTDDCKSHEALTNIIEQAINNERPEDSNHTALAGGKDGRR